MRDQLQPLERGRVERARAEENIFPRRERFGVELFGNRSGARVRVNPDLG